MNKLLILLTLALITSIAQAKPPKAQEISLYDWAQDMVREHAGLFDGDTAKFRKIRRLNNMEMCGEVNAKNRYGAYVGFTEFHIIGSPMLSDPPLISIAESGKRVSACEYWPEQPTK